jgi:serine-type D-Ala-D-Ala carboxypeptidase/endopeptidase (penicillin-binding protein 4)
MRKFSLFLLLLNSLVFHIPTIVLADTPVPSAPKQKNTEPEKICTSELGAKIDAIANNPKFSKARIGIQIETLLSKKVLYSKEGNKHFIPASNVKLLTTAAALYKLGGKFKIRTSIYGKDTTLRIVGKGDPSLKTAQLQQLVKQLKDQGYKEIDTLIIDDNYFQGDQIHPNWQWEDMNFYYGAPINSLILNENTAVLTMTPQKVGQPLQIGLDDNAQGLQIKNETITSDQDGLNNVDYKYNFGQPELRIIGQFPVNAKPITQGVSIPDPTGNFVRQFKAILIANGITVKQTLITSDRSLNDEQEIAFVESPPLSEMVKETNQHSNNVYAESIMRSLGKTADKSKFPSTLAAGLEVTKTTLKEIGIEPEGYEIDDGSGLSRQNLVSPETIIQTLRAIAKTQEAENYKKSLPLAGISGTLKKRFINTKAQAVVYAKTGTLTGASALSGYIDLPEYQPVIFSIIINQSTETIPNIRQTIDEIVLLLTKLQSCTKPNETKNTKPDMINNTIKKPQ